MILYQKINDISNVWYVPCIAWQMKLLNPSVQKGSVF
jgi:hypothetical protein